MTNLLSAARARWNTARFRSFEGRIHPQTWRRHDEVLEQARASSEKGHDTESAGSAECGDPIVREGSRLRAEVLGRFAGSLSSLEALRVLIHVPPARLSMGGFSLFSNMVDAMTHLGVPTRALGWDEDTATVLREFRPSVLLTSDAPSYLRQVDWSTVSEYRAGARLSVGLTASVDETRAPADRLRWARDNGVEFYYAFRTETYLRERPEYRELLDTGRPIYSVRFGANPLLYYPVPAAEKDLPYVFLASANRAKWGRYHLYLSGVLARYPGFLDGPGWSRIGQWAPRETHRFLYARAAVGLNLHIEDSVRYPGELNERTYILAACGVPQLVDDAKLLPTEFPAGAMFVATTPREYQRLVRAILDDQEEARRRALLALRHVYGHHTTMHRVEHFARELARRVR